MNGRVYQDGETFQPHCRIRCHCEDGGFTCVPLCSEDVRLPSWDCPHPRRVEVPGRCCPEWVCDRGGELGTQPLPAQGECGPAQARGGATWGGAGPPGGGATWGGGGASCDTPGPVKAQVSLTAAGRGWWLRRQGKPSGESPLSN